MAGDWLKFDKSTPDKPEVWSIADQLDIDPDAVVGKLLRIWGWFDDHSEDGNAPSVTRKLLDRIVGVTGFCDAMISSGWMVVDGDEIVLPNFDRHNGGTAKKRSLTAKRVARHRVTASSSNQSSNAPCNADVTQYELAREEKRREEKRRENNIKTNTSSNDEIDQSFESFWTAGMKKIGDKKKAKAKFAKLVKSSGMTPEQFTATLITDIQKRLYLCQLGFDQMHPTTYLNGERWNDEYSDNRSSQKTGGQFIPDHTDTSWADGFNPLDGGW